MPLSTTIATIIDRTKRVEICDTLHDAQNATTEEELIQAGLPLVVYSYQTGIVDDALIASDFTEATLNSFGIYTTGTFTFEDPEQETYIMRDAVVNISLSGFTNCKINVMGAGTLTLVAGDTSYATVKAYDNSVLDITINDDAMVALETREQSSTTASLNNNSILHTDSKGNSVINHTGNDSAYFLAKLSQRSELTSTLTGAASQDIQSYNSSQVFLT